MLPPCLGQPVQTAAAGSLTNCGARLSVAVDAVWAVCTPTRHRPTRSTQHTLASFQVQYQPLHVVAPLLQDNPAWPSLCCVAYLRHYTFEWAELASSVAGYWAANPPRQQSDAQRAAEEEEPEHPRDGPHKVPMPGSKRRASILQQSADAAMRTQGIPERGVASAAGTGNSTKAHITADALGDAQAHLAYVKSPKFLAPTGSSESGAQVGGRVKYTRHTP